MVKVRSGKKLMLTMNKLMNAKRYEWEEKWLGLAIVEMNEEVDSRVEV